MLHSQRAGRAENRQNAVCQMDHGGRSQRHCLPSILRRKAYVSCREYDSIPERAGNENP